MTIERPPRKNPKAIRYIGGKEIWKEETSSQSRFKSKEVLWHFFSICSPFVEPKGGR